MFETELSESVKEIKNPERKINLWVSFIIVGALSSAIIFLFRLSDSQQQRTNTALQEENKQLKIANYNLQHEKDSLRTVQYYYVLEQLKQEQKVAQFVTYQDSMNHELKTIKKELTSK